MAIRDRARFPARLAACRQCFLIFGLLLLAGLAGGRLAATTRVLPAITGYIATGFLLGPGLLNWLDESMLAQSRVLAEFSLGLIVFDLGRRLDLVWASHDRWLLPMGIAESALSFVAMFALLHFVGGIDMLEAAVAATVGIATAPAVVLLVTNELKAEGPVTRRMLWHVALNNVIATVGITLLLPFIEARASGASWNPVARALWLIAGSFLLGFIAFQLMTLLARWLGKSPVPQFILAVGHRHRDGRRRAAWPAVRAARAAGARRVRAQSRSAASAGRRRVRPRGADLLRRAVRADRRDAASRPARRRRLDRPRVRRRPPRSARRLRSMRSRGRPTSRRARRGRWRSR